MKKYMQKILMALVMILTVSFISCDKWLDLKPESEIILDEFWQTEGDVESVLASCYRGLTEESVIYRMMVWGELRSDNVVNGTNFPNARYDMQLILENDITSTNAYASWASFYAVINYCNNLLYYAPYVVDRDANFTPADLNRVKSEAYAIRALTYFYLVRAFRDVPLVTEASIDDKQDYNLPKTEESVILDTIVSDLIRARQYARTDFGKLSYNKGRFTLDAVNALLADVYLWKGDYTACVESCDAIINRSGSTLKMVSPELFYSQVFYQGNSSESIFELQFDDDVQVNTAVENLYGYSGDVFGEFSFPVTLAYNVEENIPGLYSPFVVKIGSTFIESKSDLRTKIFYRQSGGKFFVFKYSGLSRFENPDGSSVYRYRTRTANWIIYRLPEIYLMKAEALTEKAKETDDKTKIEQVLTLVNKSYMRSNEESDSLKVSNYSELADVQKLIMREKQREFLFEGKRWFDLVRLSKRDGSTNTMSDFIRTKNPGSTNNLSPTTLDAMYMPISLRELEANDKLKQNPFYEETTSSSER